MAKPRLRRRSLISTPTRYVELNKTDTRLVLFHPGRSGRARADCCGAGVSVFRPIIYGNSTVLLTPDERGESDHTHKWTIGVRSAAAAPPSPKRAPADQIGGADDLRCAQEQAGRESYSGPGADSGVDDSYFIKKVTFKLHDSFPTPLRCTSRPSTRSHTSC